MIGHDHPRNQSVSLPVEALELRLGDGGGAGVRSRQAPRPASIIASSRWWSSNLSRAAATQASKTSRGRLSTKRKVTNWTVAPASRCGQIASMMPGLVPRHRPLQPPFGPRGPRSPIFTLPRSGREERGGRDQRRLLGPRRWTAPAAVVGIRHCFSDHRGAHAPHLFAFAAAAAFVLASAGVAEARPFTAKDMVMMDRVSDPHVSPDGALCRLRPAHHRVRGEQGRARDLGARARQARRQALPPGRLRQGRDQPALVVRRPYLFPVRPLGLAAGLAHGRPGRDGRAGHRPAAGRSRPSASRPTASASSWAWRSSPTAPTSPAAPSAWPSRPRPSPRAGSTTICSCATGTPGRTGRRTTCSPCARRRQGDGRGLDLMQGVDADTPTKPYGDETDFAFTPDGANVIYSARIAGRTEPWSTNFDLCEVPADGSAAAKDLTADNPAWDAQPVVSPDGRFVAYRAQKRPGFESDRYGLMVKDLRTGATREVDPMGPLRRDPGLVARRQEPVHHRRRRRPDAAVRDRRRHRRGHAPDRPRPCGGLRRRPQGVVYAADALDAPAQLYAVDAPRPGAAHLPQPGPPGRPAVRRL